MGVTWTLMKILLFMLFYVIVGAEWADECNKLTSCSCRNSEWIIDLSPLASTGFSAKFKDIQDETGSYYYSYNPCYSFTEHDCTTVSGCQTDLTNYYSLGIQDSATFKVDASKGLYIEYVATTDYTKRTLNVYLKCDKTEEGKLDVKGENQPGSAIYEMTLTSKYCCPYYVTPTTSPSPTPVPGKHSHGEWRIVIITVCTLFALVLFVLILIYICLKLKYRNTYKPL